MIWLIKCVHQTKLRVSKKTRWIQLSTISLISRCAQLPTARYQTLSMLTLAPPKSPRTPASCLPAVNAREWVRALASNLTKLSMIRSIIPNKARNLECITRANTSTIDQIRLHRPIPSKSNRPRKMRSNSARVIKQKKCRKWGMRRLLVICWAARAKRSVKLHKTRTLLALATPPTSCHLCLSNHHPLAKTTTWLSLKVSSKKTRCPTWHICLERLMVMIRTAAAIE